LQDLHYTAILTAENSENSENRIVNLWLRRLSAYIVPKRVIGSPKFVEIASSFGIMELELNSSVSGEVSEACRNAIYEVKREMSGEDT